MRQRQRQRQRLKKEPIINSHVGAKDDDDLALGRAMYRTVCMCVEHMFLLPPSIPAWLCLSPCTLATPNYSIPKPICHSLPLTPELAPETDFEWTFSGSSWALWCWQHFFPSFGLKLNLVSVSFSVWACLAFRLCLCLLWIAIPISMPMSMLMLILTLISFGHDFHCVFICCPSLLCVSSTVAAVHWEKQIGKTISNYLLYLGIYLFCILYGMVFLQLWFSNNSTHHKMY